MFLHCVFCNFRENISPKSRAYIFQELPLFSQRLDGVLSFDFGPNLDFEGKSQGYSDGFIIRFKDQYALEAYAQNPTHQKLGRQLCGLCNGGADGITVFDIRTS